MLPLRNPSIEAVGTSTTLCRCFTPDIYKITFERQGAVECFLLKYNASCRFFVSSRRSAENDDVLMVRFKLCRLKLNVKHGIYSIRLGHLRPAWTVCFSRPLAGRPAAKRFMNDISATRSGIPFIRCINCKACVVVVLLTARELNWVIVCAFGERGPSGGNFSSVDDNKVRVVFDLVSDGHACGQIALLWLRCMWCLNGRVESTCQNVSISNGLWRWVCKCTRFQRIRFKTLVIEHACL